MNKIEIGFTAGKVWHLLDAEGDMSFSGIQKKLDLPDSLLYLAIGWLCREDKIHCVEEDGKLLLSKNLANGFFG